ncbi:MAG TPA: response regulator [Gemmatimonadales bacterium]|nr:response regulator [Gemmatimonadales bacterium]
MNDPTEILVIEDDSLDRELIAELLTLRGRGRIKVSEARDFKTAMALLSGQGFDLVMLDTRLPDATALYALRAIGDEAPLTPVLPHTSFLTPKARQSARERGAYDTVVRGELNPMWSAVNKLLTLRALGSDERERELDRSDFDRAVGE